MAYWAEKDYTPFFLFDEPVHTMREVRREYSRTRDIISKRALRLEQAGFSEQARYLRETMPRLSELKTESEIKNRLVQGHHLLSERAYSIKGIKELQKIWENITGQNIALGETLEFDEYMKSWRLSAFSNLLVPSGTAAELHKGEYHEIGGSFSDFYTIFKGGAK